MIQDTKNKDETLARVARELDIDLILLFGSRADGSNRKDSDFDIAYRSRRLLDPLRDVFPAVMEYVGNENLHLLDIKSVKPLTLYEIMRNCKVLYAEDMFDFYELRVYAFRRYYDEVRPLFDLKFNRLKAEYLSP